MDISVLDLHGTQWRSWVLDNLKRGCTPTQLIQDMVQSSVWKKSDATQAVAQALKFLDHAKPPPSHLPDITDAEIDGREIRILMRSAKPHCVMVADLFSKEECQKIIGLAQEKGLFTQQSSSSVVDPGSGIAIDHSGRTSTSVHFLQSETPYIQEIEKRLSHLTQWPLEHGEGLQILRYLPGQEYKPHYDWFHPARVDGVTHLHRGGQRVATTIVFLSCATKGGETFFAQSPLFLAPPVGGAVFFRNIDSLGQPDALSLHGGAPVLSGEKIVMTYWQRQNPFK